VSGIAIKPPADLGVAEQLTRLRGWHERTTTACSDWKTRQDVVDAIGLPYADTLWDQVETSRTVLRLVAALEVAVREHRSAKTANEVELCPLCSAVTGLLVPAPCEEMRAIAAALSEDTKESR
jgi:hypothetical protein